MAAPPAPGKKGKGPLFWITTGCLGCLTMVILAAGLIASLVYFTTKGSTAVVDQFLGDTRQQKLDDAYALLSQDYQARFSRQQFERAVEDHPVLKENAEPHFAMFQSGEVRIQNDRGVVRRTLVSTSGVRERASFHIVKENGAWRISAIVLDAGDLSGESGPDENDSSS